MADPIQVAQTVAPVVPTVKKGDLLSNAITGINGFLNTHPIIKNGLDAVIHVAIISGLTFVATALAPGSATAITAAGIATAIGAGVKSYAQHQAETYVQNQINAVAPVTDIVTPTIPVSK